MRTRTGFRPGAGRPTAHVPVLERGQIHRDAALEEIP